MRDGHRLAEAANAPFSIIFQLPGIRITGKPEVNHADEKKSGFGKEADRSVGWEVPRVFLVVAKTQDVG